MHRIFKHLLSMLTIIFFCFLGAGSVDSDSTKSNSSEPKTADEYVNEYGGRREVYQEILSMTDCNKLQEKFNIASKNNDRASPGTQHFKITMGYMQVAHNRMAEINCYK